MKYQVLISLKNFEKIYSRLSSAAAVTGTLSVKVSCKRDFVSQEMRNSVRYTVKSFIIGMLQDSR